jgi:hypothetical protein
VTRHGRPSLVLLSAEDYDRLKQIEQHATKAIKVSKLPTNDQGDEGREALASASRLTDGCRRRTASRPNCRSPFPLVGRGRIEGAHSCSHLVGAGI